MARGVKRNKLDLLREAKMENKRTTISNCRFAYKCAKTWASLQTTEQSDVKFCDDCQREVFFCRTDSQLVAAIKLNRCVAFERKSQDKDSDMQLFAGMPEGLPDHSVKQ